jgi:hypothetical protein
MILLTYYKDSHGEEYNCYVVPDDPPDELISYFVPNLDGEAKQGYDDISFNAQLIDEPENP